jgi:hypothetical protein
VLIEMKHGLTTIDLHSAGKYYQTYQLVSPQSYYRHAGPYPKIGIGECTIYFAIDYYLYAAPILKFTI